MTTSAHQTDHIDAPHSTYPYGAVRPTAGPTHRRGWLAGVAALVLLVAVGVVLVL